MRKLFLMLVVIPGLWLQAPAQTDTLALTDTAYARACRLTQAYMNGDFDSFLNQTHPRLIELSGGRDKMKALLVQGTANVKVLSVQLEKPKRLIISDTLIQCVLEQTQETRMYGSDYIMKSALIGISYDLGANWYFLNANREAMEQLKTEFPELSPELDLPPQSMPVLKNK